MDALQFLIAALLIIIFWPLIKAYALLILVALVIYWIFRSRGGNRRY